MARSLDFTSQFTLAARAVAGLAARLDFSSFVDVAFQGIHIFIVKAFTLWTVDAVPVAPHPLLAEPPSWASTTIINFDIVIQPWPVQVISIVPVNINGSSAIFIVVCHSYLLFVLECIVAVIAVIRVIDVNGVLVTAAVSQQDH